MTVGATESLAARSEGPPAHLSRLSAQNLSFSVGSAESTIVACHRGNGSSWEGGRTSWKASRRSTYPQAHAGPPTQKTAPQAWPTRPTLLGRSCDGPDWHQAESGLANRLMSIRPIAVRLHVG